MLSGLLVVGAAPAQAAPPTNSKNFLPDKTTVTSSVGDRLSDRFDGVDSTAHLTVVATPDTTRVKWFDCPSSTVGGADTTVTQADLAGCTVDIGEDTTPTTPTGNPPANVDEAYEFNWDIPGTEDGAVRDIVSLACNGAADDVEDDVSPAGDERTCVVDAEDNVILDDASTGAAATTSGEIVSFCTSDVGGPTPGLPANDPCVRGEGGTNAEVDARFSSLVHGSNIPNDGFVARVRLSNDSGTAATLILTDGDAVTEPQVQANIRAIVNCPVIFTGTNFQEFECQFTDGNVPNDAELSLGLYEDFGTGSGFCDSSVNCLVDNHYVVSNDRRPTRAVAYFSPGTTSGDDTEAVNADSSCATPDKEDTNRVGSGPIFGANPSPVNGCIFDQFGTGNKLNTTVTFESTGVGEFSDCEGTPHDHDGDGLDEHCHIDDMDADDEADADISSTVPGDQTVTFCFDAENGGATANPPPTDHGCADETVKDTLVKHWIAGLPSVVRLVYAGTGQPNTNECNTGATFRENRVGDTDDLLACTFDGFGNEVNTTDTDNGFLEWFIGSGADDEVDTQYVGTPPSETDANGHATATIEAVDSGSDNPGVQLRDEDGNTVDSDTVTKNVVPGDGGGKADSRISIRHRTRPHRFTGRVRSSDASCVSGRNVVLKRRRPGPDRTIGTDVTNAAGKYSIRHRKTRRAKTYYTRARGNADCRRATSRNLRKR